MKPILILALLPLALAAAACSGTSATDKKIVETDPVSDLTVVGGKTEPDANLIYYTGHTVCFNPQKHIPNWVSWELTKDETMGGVGRYNKFYADENVPGCAETYDYSYSGYDRGHMAPAGDMKWNPLAMKESFCMTNICPQAKSLNTGAWKTVEEKCRGWAVADGRVVVVCGPVMDPTPVEYIGDTRVWVPRRFFKVVLAPDANPPRALGFIMPNAKVEGGMDATVCTVDEVEKVTGYDFFYTLPDDVERQVEATANLHQWPGIR